MMSTRSLLTLAALAATAAPAFALGNAGFEFGTASQWTLVDRNVDSSLRSRRQATVNITDDADPSFSYSTGVLTPLDGTRMGRLELANSTTSATGQKRAFATYRFTADGQPTVSDDTLYVRLLSADYVYPTFKDFVQITYAGTQGKFVDVLKDDDFFGSAAPDTGWVAYAVPTGTKYITVKVVNAYNRFASNTPTVLLDYVQGVTPVNVTAVPEPTSIALMLAGLGVVGAAAARRRRAG